MGNSLYVRLQFSDSSLHVLIQPIFKMFMRIFGKLRVKHL